MVESSWGLRVFNSAFITAGIKELFREDKKQEEIKAKIIPPKPVKIS